MRSVLRKEGLIFSTYCILNMIIFVSTMSVFIKPKKHVANLPNSVL